MKKIHVFLFLLSFFGSFTFLLGQSSTDLMVVDTQGKGSKFVLLPTTASLLTNRPEYDNQPSFINDSELIFSAADEKGNHDLILYSFRTKKFTNLTKTPDRSEYSPSMTECGSYFAAVVVEPEGKQRLWLYPVTGEAPELLYEDILPVGYYDWHEAKAAMFVLGEPNSLVYARGKGLIDTLDTSIGRTVKKRPGTAEMTYIDRKNSIKSPEGEQFAIASYNLKTGVRKTYGYALPGSQDFIWIDKSHLAMAKGDEVYVKPITKSDWILAGKIESATHQGISRMAYSAESNRLVLVMNRKKSPNP